MFLIYKNNFYNFYFKLLVQIVIFTIFFFVIISAQSAEIILNRTDFMNVIRVSGHVFLDPDQWSCAEIIQMHSYGAIPIGWLNISRVEEGRVFSNTIDEKKILKSQPFFKRPSGTVAFYSASWRNLLLKRLKEIFEKGFHGVLLTGLYGEKFVYDHPYFEGEIISLINFIRRKVKEINPNGSVFLLLDCAEKPNEKKAELSDGIVADRLGWRDGKQVKPWERTEWLKLLLKMRRRGKTIYLVNLPRNFLKNKFNNFFPIEEFNFIDTPFPKSQIKYERFLFGPQQPIQNQRKNF